VNLFAPAPHTNLLPLDGEVYYFGAVINAEEASLYLKELLATTAWRRDEVTLFGKRIITAREVAWYGDQNFPYRYSGATKIALPWSEPLQKLKRLIEQRTGATYNSCLLNLYHDGGEGMGWHSDDERELTPQGAIASVSLGAERRFSFRHKRSGETIDVMLEHGSLLLMKGATQTHWVHRLPPARRVREARVNLTFRRMLPLGPEAGA